MKKNIVLSLLLSFCMMNVLGMENRKPMHQNKLHQKWQNKSQSRYYANKHVYKAIVTSPGTSPATVSKETIKLVVKSYGTPLVSVSKYTHKVVVKSLNTPSVIIPKETFKPVPQLFVFVPYPLSVTPEKTTFGDPRTTKMLLAHSNALFRVKGNQLAVQEADLKDSVNEKILVNHLFQTLNMFSHEK